MDKSFDVKIKSRTFWLVLVAFTGVWILSSFRDASTIFVEFLALSLLCGNMEFQIVKSENDR